MVKGLKRIGGIIYLFLFKSQLQNNIVLIGILCKATTKRTWKAHFFIISVLYRTD